MKDLFKKRSKDFDMIEDGMRRIEKFEIRKAQMEQELADVSYSFFSFYNILHKYD